MASSARSSVATRSGVPQRDRIFKEHGTTTTTTTSSSSDDEDELDNDADDLKRPNVRWTSEEQTAIFSFYGLQNAFPQTWGETRDEPQKGPSTITSIISGDASPASADIPTLPHEADTPVDTSDPLGIRDSILGRGRRGRGPLSRVEAEQYGALLITSRKFDAKHFLREVHKTTSYRDLELGADRLHAAIDHREDVIKNLVKTHFAKFVSAKSTIDSFYEQMRTKNLISSEDYGVAPFARSIEALKVDASALYTPLLERRLKAERIRTTLSVLGQWKFFFNLPSVLQGYHSKAKYDALVRDYQKGKYLMESSFGRNSQRLGVKATGKEKDALLPQAHQKVFEKVWNEAENIVSECRRELFRQLGESWVPLENQERIMTYLIELNADPDPVQLYVEKQYEWILSRLRQAYDNHLRNLDDLNKCQGDRPQQFTVSQLRKALNSVQSQEFEETFGYDMNVKLFRITVSLVRTLCDILGDCLPDFWKLCRIYCEGRLQKTRTADAELGQQRSKRRLDARKMEQCQKRIANIIDLYSMLVARAFFLDTPLAALKSIPQEEDPPSRPSIASPGEGEATSSTASPEIATIVTPATDASSAQSPLSVTTSDAGPSPVTAILPPTPISYKYSTFLTAHPLVACYYFIKIMSEFAQCCSEIRAIKIIGEDKLIPLLGMGMAKIQQRAVEVICEQLVEESREFYRYEDWSFEIDNATVDISRPLTTNAAIATDSTALLKLFYRLHKYVIRCLHRIASAPVISGPERSKQDSRDTAASGMDRAASRDSRSQTLEPEVSSTLVNQIRLAFYDSQYAILDGLEWLATGWKCPAVASPSMPTGVGGMVGDTPVRAILPGTDLQISSFGGEVRAVMGNAPVWRRKVKAVDVRQTSIRVIIIISNLAYMRTTVVPKLVALFQEKFRVTLTSDTNNLLDIVNHLDTLLFHNYMRKITRKVHDIVRQGILFSGLDWNSLPHPQEVRPHCYRVLLTLVMVHAEISEVSRLLVRRVLSELFYHLAQDLLLTFRAIDKFSPGGMLQATLETEFLHQTLTAYETPASAALLTLIYDTLERGVDQHELALAETAQDGRESMKDMLKKVKMFLAEAKQATEVEFSCFREIVDDSEGEEDHDGGGHDAEEASK
ncbi:uncharacterized protein SPPG_07153 [Spizellomyces punctatus DAOM BR117]|uniref:Exocyst complex component SEC5 n=1 Tax=Spizellomyces punctatus (strain DAOM BR117) TaxID=645134 RepID=A0A0L0H838_SPIPD|nr:uncharacterized protein SPPG_07153 [Spizellomyces punctatus DAOM BR117]KNC97690.1 hypothetical protein SPPG_07153 [Spizellomyces punctatus DAOM BR117]|eukprot:XP_016605730.1 hypothetical protein SPPG_07153 [Spizellomyces punctatus DAOM BR117]